MHEFYISSHTDTGDKKEINQDSVFVKTATINQHDVSLMIVADGCGGLEFGEQISNLIVTHFSRLWSETPEVFAPSKKINIDSLSNFLDQSLKEINTKALAFGNETGSRVGSTVSLLLTVDCHFIVKNVGDSRVYLNRGGKMIQLSEDQSLVADMIRNGELTKEESKNFKKKNILTMCVGCFEDLKIYTKTGKIKSKDIFLLCCDGLYHHVGEKVMVDILQANNISFDEKAERMRQCIAYGDANDNVSSVIIKHILHHKRIKNTAIIILLIFILAAIVFRNQIREAWQELLEPAPCSCALHNDELF